MSGWPAQSCGCLEQSFDEMDLAADACAFVIDGAVLECSDRLDPA